MANQTEMPSLLNSRQVLSFNKDWLFAKGNHSGSHMPEFDDRSWRLLQVPHDWSIEELFDADMPYGGTQAYLPRWTTAWYRKRFRIDIGNKPKLVFIQFDGIHHNSEVWINGHFLGSRPYGYVSFQYDLTPYLRSGEDNVLAVKVDNTPMPSDRWYSGSGIYRKVTLSFMDPLHVAPWGTYVTTPEISVERARVRIQTTIRNQHALQKSCTVVTEIVDSEGLAIGKAEASIALSAGDSIDIDQDIAIPTPKLWAPEHPELYTAVTSVYCEGLLVDDYRTPFGVRDIRFDQDQGFFLNGTNMKLKGVCVHHDLGCLGAAYQDRAMERRLEKLKEMGCNAIRFAHNPMSPELLDLCDRMGFLVINEAFDKWKSLYYEQVFDAWWQKDLDAMLLRDRNHPSVIMWSVGNEVENQGQDGMLEILEMLVKRCREIDSTRPVTCALEPHNSPLSLRHGTIEEKVRHTTKLAERVDVLALNYQEQWYDAYREAMPEMLIVGSETFPFYRGKGNLVKGYEPLNPWFDVESRDYVIGQFVWAGIDYLGESEYPSKGWSSGLIDTCGFRKPVSYLQQSFWSGMPFVRMAVFDDTIKQGHCPKWTMHWKSPPMASHWTHPHFEGKLLRMVIFTNCESVELIVNDESLGEQRLSDFPDRMITWHLPYSRGKVTAVGKIGGQAICTHEMMTAGEPYRVSLQADRTTLRAGGSDIAHIEVTIMDKDEVPVPEDGHDIVFELEGEGIIAGVDNGDLTSDESYISNRRTTRSGRCLVIVRSNDHAGQIRLTASSGDLQPDTITLVTEGEVP